MGDKVHGAFPTFIWKFIHSYIAMDYVSKWVEAITCPINDANTVVGFIQINILSKQAVYEIATITIISDEGSHFENKLFTKIISTYGVRDVMSLPYHPQSMSKL